MQGDGKNRLTVDIFGQQYRLSGKASVNHIRMVAGFVDDKMNEIANGNHRLDTAKIAVLSAVNIADEYFRLRQEYEELLKIIQEEAKAKPID
ncbi:cell division protein ZapA [Brevibacillus porteri]|uniref:Cell division protein ZapA n=6 Tax=Brevibacillus TaxID=55080 RepID=C0Z9E9_BREBN|nr:MULTISPECIES: cell division protein ZapA [Bacillales]ATF12233.1 cell division protein ZapA [Brevibacillus brevis X23]MCE0452209.1 cell division protein ZapA [Brevibacillus sp. AF8]MCM3141995.1 cell division protein ZapA [Brevibacillus sp. MER 51]MED1917047.1 cell division protein ZapA [Bacillus thuringiensis]NQF14493.1 cell division protein ZapA [Brevibacillus sp. HB1.3]NRS16477.1 cell division protein ZapA [Brevibacillus sp. HB1.4B]NTU20520.1 cell division protein ZapA [Brevibacillus sp.